MAALHFNALLVLGVPVAAWLTARALIRNLNGHSQSPGFHPVWPWAALATVVVFGILRNLPFAHTVWLAP